MAQMPGEGLDFRRGGSVPGVGDKELGAFRFEANVERPERARPELIRHDESGHQRDPQAGESGLADEHTVVDPEARHRAHHPRARRALKPPVGFSMPV
jgi:hypothetical protein